MAEFSSGHKSGVMILSRRNTPNVRPNAIAGTAGFTFRKAEFIETSPGPFVNTDLGGVHFDNTQGFGLSSNWFKVEHASNIAYIGLGSNLGDRAGNLLLAVRGLLEASLEISRLSSVYETEPKGMHGAPPFLNMVAEVRTGTISPTQLMARMLRIEYLLGRKDKNLNLPRTIDLDLLFFGDHRLSTPFLTLPHPRAHERNFVLIPMDEIAPDFRHPTLKKSISDLVTLTNDTSLVCRWNPLMQNGLHAPTIS
jgi:2-amino-4-hydroxy-6-hydroxymethyldihydropteridine diphosphokinase